jgi:hypothetical protein
MDEPIFSIPEFQNNLPDSTVYIHFHSDPMFLHLSFKISENGLVSVTKTL